MTFLLCDPGRYVHKLDVQNKWDENTYTHSVLPIFRAEEVVRVRYMDYTEPGENCITMILDGVCYSVIHFCRVILYVWSSPF